MGTKKVQGTSGSAATVHVGAQERPDKKKSGNMAEDSTFTNLEGVREQE